MDTEDTRYVKAENKIIAAFYALLKGKDFSDIKTKEIIETACINKSTFYAHYADKYDLLDRQEDSVIGGLYEITARLSPDILQHGDLSAELTLYYHALAQYIASKRDELRLLFTRNDDPRITVKLAAHIEQTWKEKQFPISHEGRGAYYVVALAYMIAGVIGRWLQEEAPDPPEELAAIIQSLGDNIRNAVLAGNM